MRNEWRRVLEDVWQPTTLIFLGVLLATGLLFFRLNTATRAFSAPEMAARSSSVSLRQIINNPVNAPYKTVMWAVQKTGHHGLLTMRGVSVLFALISIILFFLVARAWFTSRIAVLAGTLLLTSTWFLQAARLATPDILQTLILAPLFAGGLLRYGRNRSLALLVLALTIDLCVYIPGLIWFLIIGGAWQARHIGRELRDTPLAATILTCLGFLVLMLPLSFAVYRQPALLKTLAGLPPNFPGWTALLRNFARLPVELFVRGPADPVRWLGRLPLLDIFSIAMFVLGLYRFYFFRKLDRTKLLIGWGILGAALIALGGNVSLTLLLPLVYIIIAAGIALMLQQWFTVFPRNPLARFIGLALISVAVVITIYYQGSRYYIAWPHAPATKAVFNQKP